MEYTTSIISDIKACLLIVKDMISKAQVQGAKNFEMLYVIEEALKELNEASTFKGEISKGFLNKWDNIMGWSPKVFESHPILDSLQRLDKAIVIHRDHGTT